MKIHSQTAKPYNYFCLAYPSSSESITGIAPLAVTVNVSVTSPITGQETGLFLVVVQLGLSENWTTVGQVDK